MIKQVCRIYIYFLHCTFLIPVVCVHAQKEKEPAQKEMCQLFRFWLGKTFRNPTVVKENPPEKWKKQQKKNPPLTVKLKPHIISQTVGLAETGFQFVVQDFFLFSAINTRDLNPVFLNIPKSFLSCVHMCTHFWRCIHLKSNTWRPTQHTELWTGAGSAVADLVLNPFLNQEQI